MMMVRVMMWQTTSGIGQAASSCSSVAGRLLLRHILMLMLCSIFLCMMIVPLIHHASYTAS